MSLFLFFFKVLQSSPLLEPTFEAVIRIQGGVVESAVAEESYLLRPFADRSNGVKTKITTKLTLESKAAGSIPGKFIFHLFVNLA